MAVATQYVSVTVTYADASGSTTQQWVWPVVAGTAAAMNAAADQCVNNQFANMKSAGTMTIGAHTLLPDSRLNQPFAP